MSFRSLSAWRATSDFTPSQARLTSLLNRSLSSWRSSCRKVRPKPAVESAVKNPNAKTSCGARRMPAVSWRASRTCDRAKVDPARGEREPDVRDPRPLNADLAKHSDPKRSAQGTHGRFDSRRVAHDVDRMGRVIGGGEPHERSERRTAERTSHVEREDIRARRTA